MTAGGVEDSAHDGSGTGKAGAAHTHLDADDAVLAERVLDELVVGQRQPLLVDLGEAALVDELAHSLEVRLAERDIALEERNKTTSTQSGRGLADEGGRCGTRGEGRSGSVSARVGARCVVTRHQAPWHPPVYCRGGVVI